MLLIVVLLILPVRVGFNRLDCQPSGWACFKEFAFAFDVVADLSFLVDLVLCFFTAYFER